MRLLLDLAREKERGHSDDYASFSVGETVTSPFAERKTYTIKPEDLDQLARLRLMTQTAALLGGTVTYSQVEALIGIPHRRPGRLLDLLSTQCQRAGEPSLAALVVQKHTGRCGYNFDGDEDKARLACYDHWQRIG